MIKIKKEDLVKNYDFFDFGSGRGGCLDFCKKNLGGNIGLGFDLSKEKIEIVKEKGFDCCIVDITNLSLPEKYVDFVSISHLLEHLDSIKQIEHTIKLAVNSAKRFVFIEGPCFDYDVILHNKYGMKFYWSDWSGHTCKVKVPTVFNILNKCGVEKIDLLLPKPIFNSKDSRVHPLASPKDQFDYIDGIHPKKKKVEFEEAIFDSWIIFGWIDQKYRNPTLLKSRKKYHKIPLI